MGRVFLEDWVGEEVSAKRDNLGRRNNMLELTDADRERCVCGHIRKWHHQWQDHPGWCSMCDSAPYEANCSMFVSEGAMP